MRAAMRDMVVDSPPGMMSAAHVESCSAVRTGRKVKVAVEGGMVVAARRRCCRCSLKAPWRARTPMVRESGAGVADIMMVVVVAGLMAG